MATYDRVLILGGGGMLARAFREEVGVRAREVFAPSRGELDVTDSEALGRVMESFRPTLVVNCAAHTKVDLCTYQRDLALAINGLAAGVAAGLAFGAGAAFVHFSTDFVFSGKPPGGAGWREEDRPAPVSEYGRSKLAGELAVGAAHPGALIVRTSWLFGPGGPCFPATMVRSARAGKPLWVVADQFGSPTLTVDLARAALGLVDAGADGGTYHVCNSGETTWFGFTGEILREFGLSVPLSALTSGEWKARVPTSADRPGRSTLDCSKAVGVLGVPMRRWEEALREYRRLRPD